MKCLLLIMMVFATYENENLDSETRSEEKNVVEHPTVVKIEEDEYVKENKKTSTYFGVFYHKTKAKWCACRRSKNEKKTVANGTYKYEDTAAHASDTLARKLMANGEKGHKLNFPGDHTEVYSNEVKSSNYFGVSYDKTNARWFAYRWSKNERKKVRGGTYKVEETAAHASDNLARKLIANGEKVHELNFPDKDIEVYPEEKYSSNYIGVTHDKRYSTWFTHRWGKNEKKTVYNGTYNDEETAAHASDALARKLIANGETGHKLNFPGDHTEFYPEEATYQKQKRKRSDNSGNSQENKSHQSPKK